MYREGQKAVDAVNDVTRNVDKGVSDVIEMMGACEDVSVEAARAGATT